MKKKTYQIPALEVAGTTVLLLQSISLRKTNIEESDEEEVLSKKSERDDYVADGWTEGLW